MIGYDKILGLILLSYKKNIVSLQRENKNNPKQVWRKIQWVANYLAN